MGETRRIVKCTRCGKDKEHAAHGLCAACDMADRRAKKYEEQMAAFRAAYGCETPGITPQQASVVKAYWSITHGLAVLGVSKPNLSAVQDVLAPYLMPVQHILNVARGYDMYADDNDDDAGHSSGECANSEHTDHVYVNCPDPGEEQKDLTSVNSEQQAMLTVNGEREPLNGEQQQKGVRKRVQLIVSPTVNTKQGAAPASRFVYKPRPWFMWSARVHQTRYGSPLNTGEELEVKPVNKKKQKLPGLKLPRFNARWWKR